LSSDSRAWNRRRNCILCHQKVVLEVQAALGFGHLTNDEHCFIGRLSLPAAKAVGNRCTGVDAIAFNRCLLRLNNKITVRGKVVPSLRLLTLILGDVEGCRRIVLEEHPRNHLTTPQSPNHQPETQRCLPVPPQQESHVP